MNFVPSNNLYLPKEIMSKAGKKSFSIFKKDITQMNNVKILKYLKEDNKDNLKIARIKVLL